MKRRFALPVLLLIPVAPAVTYDRPSAATTHTVEIRNFAFVPARLHVAVGDTVVWINRDVVPHTVTDSSSRSGSGEIGAGERWRWVAGEAGSVRYLCDYHPSMLGTIAVVETRDPPVEIRVENQRRGGNVRDAESGGRGKDGPRARDVLGRSAEIP